MTDIKSISIPQPCSQSWQQMEERQQGRHCLHCCKTVIDFTRMSNDEILAYLSNAGNVCWRLNENQLSNINYQLTTEEKAGISGWKKWLVAASLLSAGLSARAFAQAVAKPAVTQASSDTFAAKIPILGKVALSGIQNQRNILGRVISADDSLPLPGVVINIKGTSNKVLTDVNGHFSIAVQPGDSILVANYIGFISQEISLKSINSDTLKITMQLQDADPQHVVVVGGVVTVRYPFYKRWYYRYIKRPIHKIFN